MRVLLIVAGVWLLSGKSSCQLLGGASGASAPQKAPQANPLRWQKPYSICTSHWMPFVNCQGMSDQADYSGHQIELWRMIAADLGLVEGTDYDWECLDWFDMMDNVMKQDGNCTLAIAGIDVTSERILAGLKFSLPVASNGLQVAISGRVPRLTAYSFFEVFEWPLWLLYIGTGAVVSYLVNLAEIFLYGGWHKLKSSKTQRFGMRTWVWYVYNKLVRQQTYVGDPETWAAKVLVVGWAFLVLIVCHLYTASLTVKVHKERQVPSIYGLKDLPGKKVITWSDYVTRLRSYRVTADGFKWDADTDEDMLFEALQSPEYAALALDKTVVLRHAWLSPDCSIYPVGDVFAKTDIAIAFPHDVPDALAGQISASILRIQPTGALDALENKYLKAPPNADYRCSATLDKNARPQGTAPPLSFAELTGLWGILLGTAAFCSVLTLVVWLKYRRKVYDSTTGSMHSAPGTVAAAEAATAAGNMADEPADKTPKDPDNGSNKPVELRSQELSTKLAWHAEADSPKGALHLAIHNELQGDSSPQADTEGQVNGVPQHEDDSGTTVKESLVLPSTEGGEWDPHIRTENQGAQP